MKTINRHYPQSVSAFTIDAWKVFNKPETNAMYIAEHTLDQETRYFAFSRFPKQCNGEFVEAQSSGDELVLRGQGPKGLVKQIADAVGEDSLVEIEKCQESHKIGPYQFPEIYIVTKINPESPRLRFPMNSL